MDDFFSSEEFHRCMLEIDDAISVDYPNVSERELHATIEFGKRFPGTCLPIDQNNPVYQWYINMYGERIKRFGPWLHYIILIKNTPYKVIVPIIFGSRLFNPFSLIEGITLLRINSLCYDEKNKISDDIIRLFMCMSRIERLNLLLWYGDLSVSISSIMNRRPHYGISKWASLQMVEKVIKNYMLKKGIKPPTGSAGHNIPYLFNIATKLGMARPDDCLIDIVKCSAGVRYGEIKVSIHDAVESQHAAILLCDHVASEMGLGQAVEFKYIEGR